MQSLIMYQPEYHMLCDGTETLTILNYRIIIVQNSQNFSGLFPSSCIPKNMTFRKLDLFPSSGEGGEKTPTQLGPLERANLSHSSPPSPEDGNRSSFRNVVFFGIQDDGESPEKFCEFCTTYTIVRILSSLPE
jgi:hypothetical protein